MKKINFLVLLLISVIFITSCEKKEDSKPHNKSPKVYIKLNKDVIYPMIGETEDLKVTILSEKEANSELVWKSTDESVATVDNKGKVTAVKNGNAIITVATKDGSKSAICEVNVIEAKITLTSEEPSIYLSIGAAEEDRGNIWIDINANGKKDEGEKVTGFSNTVEYFTTAKTITIYGKVTSLNCYNGFTTLDLSKNVALTSLDCSGNDLTTLDLSKNVALTNLICSNNKLTTLDLSKNVVLTSLDYSGNKLTTLDLSKNVALTSLKCYQNKLTTLDLSKNVALTYLECYENKLTTLDLSKNVALTSLKCYENDLTTLDLSKNVELIECYRNKLITLDLSKNVALTSLKCYQNKLTTLDLSKNVALTSLNCYDNKLTTLDLSKNVALISLDCSWNKLTTLDLSKNVALTSLECYKNELTTLDLSKNVALTFLNCSRNENLIKLNVANGNNIKFENSDGFSNGVNYAFKASECPKLKCIKIDEGFNPDAQTEEDKIWIKDDTASYSTTDCK